MRQLDSHSDALCVGHAVQPETSWPLLRNTATNATPRPNGNAQQDRMRTWNNTISIYKKREYLKLSNIAHRGDIQFLMCGRPRTRNCAHELRCVQQNVCRAIHLILLGTAVRAFYKLQLLSTRMAPTILPPSCRGSWSQTEYLTRFERGTHKTQSFYKVTASQIKC